MMISLWLPHHCTQLALGTIEAKVIGQQHIGSEKPRQAPGDHPKAAAKDTQNNKMHGCLNYSKQRAAKKKYWLVITPDPIVVLVLTHPYSSATLGASGLGKVWFLDMCVYHNCRIALPETRCYFLTPLPLPLPPTVLCRRQTCRLLVLGHRETVWFREGGT